MGWAVSWAVITILCYYDYLPLVNSFLSHWMWTPFARLTYGAYLVHPLIIKLAAGTSTQYYNYSSLDLFCRWLGNSTIAFGCSLLLWCLLERPTMTLTSQFLKKKAPPRDAKKPPVGAAWAAARAHTVLQLTHANFSFF